MRERSQILGAAYMRSAGRKAASSHSGIAPAFSGTSKKLKTKTFLAAEAQSTQRKPWFFPLRTLRLCGKAFSCELLASRLVVFLEASVACALCRVRPRVQVLH
jgi:hypothetical protein